MRAALAMTARLARPVAAGLALCLPVAAGLALSLPVAAGLALCLPVAAGLALCLPAAAQTAADPVTGARPGNVIGTGQSLPLSDQASNATAGDTRTLIAPRLPTPSAGDDSSPRAFLEAAQRALVLGRTGEAQEALERAESRLLDRSVAPSRAGVPSAQPVVQQVSDARRALAAGDRARSQQIIGDVLNRLRG